MWKLVMRPCNSQKRITKMGFLLQCMAVSVIIIGIFLFFSAEFLQVRELERGDGGAWLQGGGVPRSLPRPPQADGEGHLTLRNQVDILYDCTLGAMGHRPLPIVRDLTRDGRWNAYDVYVPETHIMHFIRRC
jgi:hypothetical protein